MTVSFADPFDVPQFSKKYSVILKRLRGYVLTRFSRKRLRGYVLTGLLLFVKTTLKSRDCGQRKSRAIRPAFSLPTYLEGDFCMLQPGSR